jgi:ADP-ribose pyrophosphatase YjhB (NUDIX family)
MKTSPHPPPVAGAGAIVFRGGDVLLVRRTKPPLDGQWSLPGGRIEFGETAEAAALRELREETGVEADVVALAGVFDFIGEGQHLLLVDYAMRWRAGEPCAGDDAADARFFAPADLPGLGLWDATLRAIETARALTGPA